MRGRIAALLAGIGMLTVAGATGQQAVAVERSTSAPAATVTYSINVRTGDVAQAGTDANVWVSIRGNRGRSGVLELDSPRNDFERSGYDSYARLLNDLGTVNRICVYRDDAGLFDDWYLDFVSVETLNAPSTRRTAPFHIWVPVGSWACRTAS